MLSEYPRYQTTQHRLGQYRGEHATVCDARPNPRIRRCASDEDDPGKVKVVNTFLARRWLLEDAGRLERMVALMGLMSLDEAAARLGSMDEDERKRAKERIA